MATVFARFQPVGWDSFVLFFDAPAMSADSVAGSRNFRDSSRQLGRYPNATIRSEWRFQARSGTARTQRPPIYF